MRGHQHRQQPGAGGDRSGVFPYGDASPAMGGGIGSFLWVPTRDEMLAHIATHLAYSMPGPTGTSAADVAETVAALVAEHQKGSVNADDCLSGVNAALKNFSQISWCGQLPDLLEGTGEFPVSLRATFRDEDEEEDGAGLEPIQQDELEDYMAYIREYGF